MNSSLLSYVCIALYLAATAGWGGNIFKPGWPRPGQKARLLAFSAAPLLLHALVLYHHIFTGTGLNFGFCNALSLMSWAVAVILVAVAAFRPVENLAVVLLPFAALSLLLEQVVPGPQFVLESAPPGLRIHIVLSVGAYGLLAIAAVQAVVLAMQEHQLRSKHPVRAMRVLPPLQVMEDLLVQFLATGFFLLSLSLTTGLMFLHDLFGQHLANKTVLSVSAWLIFGGVLVGRWRRGWRGRRLVGWTLGGFALLVLAYFGTKLMLETILHHA